MKRNSIILIGVIAVVTVLLAGCRESRRLKEARFLAEDYLCELKVQVLDETLRLTDADAERFGKMYAFIAYSEKYGDDFRIYANSDDKVTDSYFAVSLREAAKNEFSELIDRVIPGKNLSFALSLDKYSVSSALSGRTFSPSGTSKK